MIQREFPGSRNNAGNLTINDGSGTVTIDAVPFDNTGTVNVLAGALAINTTGSSSGAFNIASGTSLQFHADITTNDPFIIAPGASFTGNGDVEVDAEFMYLELDTSISIANLVFSDGTIQGSGGLTVTSTFDWTGFDFTGSGTLTISSGASMTIDGTSTEVFDGWTLNNSGTVAWSGSEAINSTGTFNNMSGGLFTVEAGARWTAAGGGIVNNAGTMNVNTGTGTATFAGGTFNNSGTLNVDTGSLAMGSAGTDVGIFDVLEGASLQFDADIATNDPFIIAPGATLEGTGDYEVDDEFMYLELDTAISIPKISIFLPDGTIRRIRQLSTVTTWLIRLDGHRVQRFRHAQHPSRGDYDDRRHQCRSFQRLDAR